MITTENSPTPALPGVPGGIAQPRVRPVAGTNDSKRNWFVLSVILLAAIIAFGFICLFTGKSLEGVSLIVGCLITKLGTLIDFMYGSSQGSKDKDSLNRPLKSESESTGLKDEQNDGDA